MLREHEIKIWELAKRTAEIEAMIARRRAELERLRAGRGVTDNDLDVAEDAHQQL